VRSCSVVRLAGENLRVRSDAGPCSSREFLSAYISGYVDGEGCFTVSISPRATRGGMGGEAKLLGQPERRSSRGHHAIAAHFGCGSIRPDRSDKTVKWETRRLEDILERVIPHFRRYPLLSGKRADFERFAAICEQMRQGAHREREGLIRIVEIAAEMNPSGRRRYTAAEVLAHLLQGEGIVCAPGNRG
jgi:LAGLIDADG endonuclease